MDEEALIDKWCDYIFDNVLREKQARKGYVASKGERENVLKYNKSAGIKLALTEGKEIDTALAFV